MDTAARGQTQKSFRYVVRAPGSDGSDVMNVDLKIDTAWLFQDADNAREEQGNLLEGVVSGPGMDTGTLREQLESSEQKLLAAVDKYAVSESGLRSRIQELELSEQRLLRKVDQLSTWVVQERNASLQAQRQLVALQGELASQCVPSSAPLPGHPLQGNPSSVPPPEHSLKCALSSAPPPEHSLQCAPVMVREQERMAGRLRERLRLRDQALGQQTVALERSRRTQRRQLGLAREQERELRAQVRRLEGDVRRLCRAAGRLLAELDAPARLRPQGPAVEAAEEAAARRRQAERATERRLRAQLEELRCCVYELKLSEIGLQGQVEDLTEQNRSLREELGAKVPGEKARGMTPAGHCSLTELLEGGARSAGLGSLSPTAAGRRPSTAELEGLLGGASCVAQGTFLKVWRRGIHITIITIVITITTVTITIFIVIITMLITIITAQCPGSLQGQAGTLPLGAPGTVVSLGNFDFFMILALVKFVKDGPFVPRALVPSRLAEGPCAWGCAGAGQGPLVLVPGPETMGVLLGDLTGSDREQLALALHPLDEQTLGLVCGCPPRQCVDGSLLPVDLPQPSEQSPVATSAQGSFLLVQMSSLPLCWSAGDPNPLSLLLLPDTSPETPQIQEVLDARPLLAPQAAGHAGRAYHQAWGHGALHQESPQILSPQHPGKGPQGLKETLTEGGGAPGWGVEQSETRRTLDSPRGQCPWCQDAPGTQASSQGPRLEQPRQGEASGPEGSPESLGGRRGVWGQVWSLPGGHWSEREEVPPATLTEAHRTEGSSPRAGQLWVEKGGACGRGGKDKEQKHPWFGGAERLLEESPGEEGPGEEEKGVLHQEGASPGLRDAPEELGPEGCDDRDSLCLAEQQGWPQSPGLPWPAEGGDPARGGPWAPGADGGQYGRAIDAFEEEMMACLQQLSALQLGSGGPRWEKSTLAGEDWGFARKWPSRENRACALEVSANRGVGVRSAEEAAPKETGKATVLGRTGAPGARVASPGTVSRLDGRSPGGNQLSGDLEQVRRRCSQLIARLKKESSAVLRDYARLRGDQERSHRKVRALQRERERRERRVSALEQDNRRLSGDVSHLRIEVDQYLQLISDLEDCNGKSYRRISELEEEKEALQEKLGQTLRERSQSAQRAEGVLERAVRENAELWALTSELRVGYQGLIQDIVLGTEDVIRGLQEEKARLLCRVRALEKAAPTGVHPNTGRLGRRGERGQAGAVDEAVQVAQLSGQRLARVGGLSWEEDTVQTVEQGDASSGAESPRGGANPPTPSSAWGNAMVTRVLRENICGAGVEAGVHTEKRPQGSGDQGPEPQGVEAEAAEEGLRLRIGQLHHQVLTLKHQLWDQGSLHWELQASPEETGRLRQELQNQRKDFQKRQREANLAMSLLKCPSCEIRAPSTLCTQTSMSPSRESVPTRKPRYREEPAGGGAKATLLTTCCSEPGTPREAKVTSLVQKCQERNSLITYLLQELHQRGVASPILAEWARSMVDDEALAEYAATFLTTGIREIPLPAGLKYDPWTSLVTGDEEPGFLAPYPQDRGGKPCPAHHADGLPPLSELRSPVRILALHKELRQSICSSSQVNKSLLDLQV
ncbi:LOW QUALITY PROTEIN: uncharacterized protein C4orf50 homolog [Dugong dugon]